MRILIVGGYGVFGARLVQLLEVDARLTLLVAGRSIERAKRLCASRTHAQARLLAVTLDRSRVDAAQLSALEVAVAVDASGPFQGYGDDAWRLVESCIAAGVHYLDLADGARFVDGVARFDAAARAASVFALSGVSSFPVLTAAVARRLSHGLAEVEAIRGGIAPSPFAGVGRNVIRAVASYAGQPVTLVRGGRQAVGHPFTETLRFVISVPGQVPLGSRRFSLVEVPDLAALPAQWPAAREVWMGAAPAPALLHAALRALAWLVRLRCLPSLLPLAPLIEYVTNHVRWGEHRGGMFVEVRGRHDDMSRCVRTWHLLAEGDDGPLIPSMAVQAVLARVLQGKPPAAGARAAVCDLELNDYETLFAQRTITTGVRDQPSDGASLYERVLGAAWQRLPPPLRRLHGAGAARTHEGRCSVRRGANPLCKLVAWVIGFPPEGDDLPVEFRIEAAGSGGELWQRRIGAHRFASTQSQGQGRSEWLVRERFGVVAVDMALTADDRGLTYAVRGWTLCGVPMPLWAGPRAQASEGADAERFTFDVRISLPLAGLVAHYQGWLLPSAGASAPVRSSSSPASCGAR